MAEESTADIYLQLAHDLLDLALQLKSESDRKVLADAAFELIRLATEDGSLFQPNDRH